MFLRKVVFSVHAMFHVYAWVGCFARWRAGSELWDLLSFSARKVSFCFFNVGFATCALSTIDDNWCHVSFHRGPSGWDNEPHSWRNLNVKRLLCNVTKNTVFTFNNRLHRQIDGCRMGNPLSPVLGNIFMAKLEEDVVHPYHPPFYDRYVDDCFSKKVENETDRLLDIKFTVEEKPNHFLNIAYNY